MRPGTFYGVGIGPGDPRYMTLRAAEVLKLADVIFTVTSPHAAYSVSCSAVKSLAPLRGEIRVLTFSMSRDPDIRATQIAANAKAIADELRAGRDCAFATIGDAMTYSTFGYVLEHIRADVPDVDIEIVPGVNSFSALAAKSGQVLIENGQTLRVIPAFRQEMAETLDLPPDSTTVLLKTYHSRSALLDRLEREPGVTVVYGERLGLGEEFITTDVDNIRSRSEEYLSLMMIKKR